MADLFSNPVFGISMSVAAYAIGVWVNKRLKTPLANPLLIALILLVAFFVITGIPLDYYNKGGDIISFLIFPATASETILLKPSRLRVLVAEMPSSV